ncbi:unnamed protein product [Closterium sp. NIES-65]|nr:unnamed protein product [Closterium sp. NIES-65]
MRSPLRLSLLAVALLAAAPLQLSLPSPFLLPPLFNSPCRRPSCCRPSSTLLAVALLVAAPLQLSLSSPFLLPPLFNSPCRRPSCCRPSSTLLAVALLAAAPLQLSLPSPFLLPPLFNSPCRRPSCCRPSSTLHSVSLLAAAPLQLSFPSPFLLPPLFNSPCRRPSCCRPSSSLLARPFAGVTKCDDVKSKDCTQPKTYLFGLIKGKDPTNQEIMDCLVKRDQQLKECSMSDCLMSMSAAYQLSLCSAAESGESMCGPPRPRVHVLWGSAIMVPTRASHGKAIPLTFLQGGSVYGVYAEPNSPVCASAVRLTLFSVWVFVGAWADVTVTRLVNRVLVYGLESGLPMLFDCDGRGTEIYPTVFALWLVPDLLPSFLLKGGEVSRYVLSGADLMAPGVQVRVRRAGADLMAPGVQVPAEGLPAFRPGEVWSVKVGITMVGSADAVGAGMRGKLLRITHYYRDSLWETSEGSYVPNKGFLPDLVVPDPDAEPVPSDGAAPEDSPGGGLGVAGAGEGEGEAGQGEGRGDEGGEAGAVMEEGAAAAASSEQLSESLQHLGMHDTAAAAAASADTAVGGSEGDQRAAAAAAEETAESAAAMALTPAQMDELLDRSLLQALSVSVKPAHLPLGASTLCQLSLVSFPFGSRSLVTSLPGGIDTSTGGILKSALSVSVKPAHLPLGASSLW